MTDQPTEAPSAAAERIVSPIYDHEVIFEGIVVSRADLERLTAERDDARAALRAAEGREATLREALLEFIAKDLPEIGAYTDEAWWWHDKIAEALASVLAAPDRPDLEVTDDG